MTDQQIPVHTSSMTTIQPSMPRLQSAQTLSTVTSPVRHVPCGGHMLQILCSGHYTEPCTKEHCICSVATCSTCLNVICSDMIGLGYKRPFMQFGDSLVAKQHLHGLIGRYLTLVGEGDKSTQVVHLALNQSIHSPEDRVQVGQPYPATNMRSCQEPVWESTAIQHAAALVALQRCKAVAL